jgi:hypothetical protein
MEVADRSRRPISHSSVGSTPASRPAAAGSVVGKLPTTAARRPISRLTRSSGSVLPSSGQGSAGKASKASNPVSAAANSAASWGARLVGDLAEPLTGLGAGGGGAEAAERDRAARPGQPSTWPIACRSPRAHRRWRARRRPAPGPAAREERPPERLGLGLTDVQAEHRAAAAGWTPPAITSAWWRTRPARAPAPVAELLAQAPAPPPGLVLVRWRRPSWATSRSTSRVETPTEASPRPRPGPARPAGGLQKAREAAAPGAAGDGQLQLTDPGSQDRGREPWGA